VTPNGLRIVSQANLEKTWTGQIALSPTTGYAMGWLDVHADGGRLLAHSGSIDGFRTDMTMLPGAGIGILIFSNSDSGAYFGSTIRDWVPQNLGEVPANGVEGHLQAYAAQKEFIRSLRASVVSYKPECKPVAGFTGSYEKGWVVRYEDHQLWLTRDNYYRVPLLETTADYVLGGGWDDLTLSSPRAMFVRDEDGSRHMNLSRIDAGSSERIRLDSVRLLAPEPCH
jgi:hypothetical protein